MGWQSVRIVGASSCAPEKEDGEMYLWVLAHLGCPGHSPESHKMVVVVAVVVVVVAVVVIVTNYFVFSRQNT